MSHFVKIKTKIRDRASLIKALEKLGFKDKIESYESAQHLYGYHGDKREQIAHIILRRKYVGSASNDIGFEQLPDGSFIAHISEYDHGRYGEAWQKKLFEFYGVEKAKTEFDNLGLSYVEDVEENDHPRLRVMI
jgi:hypothetical protein